MGIRNGWWDGSRIRERSFCPREVVVFVLNLCGLNLGLPGFGRHTETVNRGRGSKLIRALVYPLSNGKEISISFGPCASSMSWTSLTFVL